MGAALLLGAGSVRAVDPNFSVCASEFPLTPLLRVIYATDAGVMRLDAMTGEGYLTAGELEAGDTWDFSNLGGGVDVLQFTPPTSTWSCSVGENCAAFDISDLLMTEDDLDTGDRNFNAIDYDGGSTIYLRGLVFEDSEPTQMQVCFEADVPFLRFPSPGNCMLEGDGPWSVSLDCDRSASLDNPCGADPPAAGLIGQGVGRAVRAGTLTLPSGHQVDALLTEFYVDGEVWGLLLNNCVIPTGVTLTRYLLLWLTPHYGVLAQLTSPDGVTDLSWEQAATSSIGFGLLPPVSVSLDAVGPDSITVSWDPGADTRFIDEYVVHWGTESGHTTPPPFDSVAAGDTIPVAQTSYTIRGLTPTTTYYVSVSARSDYTDPVAGVTTSYSSIVLPDSIGADIDGDGTRDTSYPPELSAITSGGGPTSLLRNTLISIDPVMPALDTLLPLDPVADEHITPFASGDTDLDDTGMPMVLYGLNQALTMRMVKTAGGDIQFWF
jgi:hypothetical protein